MVYDPNNRSSLQSNLNEQISWEEVPQEFRDAYDKLFRLLDDVETRINAVTEEVENLPESFDGVGDYVEFDSLIEQLNEICDMMY